MLPDQARQRYDIAATIGALFKIRPKIAGKPQFGFGQSKALLKNRETVAINNADRFSLICMDCRMRMTIEFAGRGAVW